MSRCSLANRLIRLGKPFVCFGVFVLSLWVVEPTRLLRGLNRQAVPEWRVRVVKESCCFVVQDMGETLILARPSYGVAEKG